MTSAWVGAVDPDFVDRRFGVDGVNAALAVPRVYVDPPILDGARLVGIVVEAPGGRRLSTPHKATVRLRDDVIDVACTCRHARLCDHVRGLLVDIAFDAELRAAIVEGRAEPAHLRALATTRARALEARTLDQRLAAWLPPRAFDDDFELDVEVIQVASVAVGEGRSAVLLRHRRPASRSLVPARDLLGARLRPRHRNLVDLTVPYHVDRNVLVATRGQASLLVSLLQHEIGLFADGFKARVRFGADPVVPRLERVGDRLVARWYGNGEALVADAGDAFVLAGPTPYLWAASARTFHPIEPSVDLDLAMGLQRIPSLPIDAGGAARVGRALLARSRGLGVGVPAPEVFGLPPLETPTFELRVAGSPLALRAELFAVYRAVRLRIGDDHVADGRDLEAEDRAASLVDDVGLLPDDEDRAVRRAAEEQAVLFWQNVERLRRTESPRFEVFLGEALARTSVGPPLQAEVDVRCGAETGWLDTQLEFRASSLSVEIAHLHRVLASSKRWVVLSDGSLARITDEVAALLGEAADLVGAFGTGRLPPHQFGRIARWIELADGVASGVQVRLDPSLSRLRDRLRDLVRSAEEASFVPSRLEATLRPYQRVGLAWLVLLRELGAGGLLADDMGLGKTLMTLAFLAGWNEASGPAPSLVVCPTSVVGNWLREAGRFTPWLRVCAWQGADRREAALAEHDLVVTTYGVLRRDVERLAKTRFRCVVLDEAQNVKNPASETSRAARRLDGAMRLALTGTPVENRLSELWSLMTFANPGMLGTAAEFDFRYERPMAAAPGGTAAIAAELRAVVRPFILRRTKAEVLSELPPKTEVERACVFGLRQKRLYDALALALRQAMAKDPGQRKGARAQLSVLTGILRLRQMACDPRLVDPDASPNDSAKRAHFLELVRELVAEGRRALVFSQFVELLALWRQDLDEAKVAYEYLDGSTTGRDAVVARFQRGSAPLFLVSLKAGGAGLNLTAADTVIHCDPWWNPAAEDQATDRAHRIGQDKPVTVVRLVARGTIEDKIALLKTKKSELAAAVLGNTDALDGRGLGSLDDDEIRELFADVEGDHDDVAGEGEGESEA